VGRYWENWTVYIVDLATAQMVQYDVVIVIWRQITIVASLRFNNRPDLSYIIGGLGWQRIAASLSISSDRVSPILRDATVTN
jgi:hypothetical protein